MTAVRAAVGSSVGELAAANARHTLHGLAVYPYGMLDDLYVDAYATGAQLAQGFVNNPDQTNKTVTAVQTDAPTNWAEWVPGDLATAEAYLSGPDAAYTLRALLAKQNITIKSISDWRLNDLAVAVADSIATGGTNRDLSALLTTILDDPARADMVAATEVTRALVAGAYDQYTAMGVQLVAFLSAEDNRVCPLCTENEAQGPLPINQDFINGAPPTHPNCRCTIIPF